MNRPVILHDRAKAFLRDATDWWAKSRSAQQAERWFEGFVSRLNELTETAEQCPLASENDAFPFEVREVHYGLSHRVTHRALFTIRPDIVYVFVIRHVAQQDVRPDDL